MSALTKFTVGGVGLLLVLAIAIWAGHARAAAESGGISPGPSSEEVPILIKDDSPIGCKIKTYAKMAPRGRYRYDLTIYVQEKYPDGSWRTVAITDAKGRSSRQRDRQSTQPKLRLWLGERAVSRLDEARHNVTVIHSFETIPRNSQLEGAYTFYQRSQRLKPSDCAPPPAP